MFSGDIQSYVYLDSDPINFRTFVFLVVYTHTMYTTQTSKTNNANNESGSHGIYNDYL